MSRVPERRRKRSDDELRKQRQEIEGEWLTPATTGSANVTEHDIARHAFDLYCERGCQHGHDLDDWLRAERELLGVKVT